MIERLQRALEHIEELSPEMQEDLAQQIEELLPSVETGPSALPIPLSETNLPSRTQRALAAIGFARDLQYDDEFEALERIRHSSEPSPPPDYDDL
jgi:hypothetical protein